MQPSLQERVWVGLESGPTPGFRKKRTALLVLSSTGGVQCCSSVVGETTDVKGMGDVQIEQHPGASSVALVAWRGDLWLWFSVAGGLVPQFIPANEIGDALQSGLGTGDARTKSYLEVRMQAAGYRLRPTAIQHEDLAVWEIDTQLG
jgi:hypothetical protein